MSVSGRGRLCNHIIRNICISLIAEKNDIKFTYGFATDIERLGIRLFSGSRVFDNDIAINDNNFFELLNKPNIESNLVDDGYFQTKEITNYLYRYLRKEDVRASIIKSNQFSHFTGKNNNVFVHVRLGDVPHLNPGVRYYDSILSRLVFNVGYIASDSPTHEICNQLAKKYRLNVLALDEVDTLKFGSTCKYIVLSGGTFSSCIGYLAYDSVVYYPRRDRTKVWHGDIFSIPGWIEK